MKTNPLVVSLGCALLLASCTAPPTGGGGVDKRLAEVEKKVATLQAQNTDLRAKVRTSHAFPTGNPLTDFFNSPEFWQCTYDSSWSDCSSRCSKATSDRYKACLMKPEGPERVNCINQSSADGAACLKACPVQTSPTDPPSCSGGGGPA